MDLANVQIPRVEIAFMNDDHDEAALILGDMFSAIANGENSEIEQKLTALYQHSVEHFAREEEQMLQVNFPPYQCHKGEHERVLQEMRDVLGQWQSGHDRTILSQYLENTVVPWLINHISTMDTVTAMFINRQSA